MIFDRAAKEFGFLSIIWELKDVMQRQWTG